MSKTISFFADNGAIGDQAFNICQIRDICEYYGVKGLDLYTYRKFLHNIEGKLYVKESNPDVFYIWSQCKYINNINFIDYLDNNSSKKMKNNYDLYIDRPKDEMVSEQHKISEYLSLTPMPKSQYIGKKVAIFQPVSVINRPGEIFKKYLVRWDLSLRILIEKGYTIYMIGSENDFDLVKKYNLVQDSCLSYIENLCGKIKMIDAIKLVLYRADFVIGCDSWATTYGIAERIPTAVSWGPKLEAGGRESKLPFYLGNKDIYINRWASKGDADGFIFEWIIKNF